jgi:hypothetical protein
LMLPNRIRTNRRVFQRPLSGAGRRFPWRNGIRRSGNNRTAIRRILNWAAARSRGGLLRGPRFRVWRGHRLHRPFSKSQLRNEDGVPNLFLALQAIKSIAGYLQLEAGIGRARRLPLRGEAWGLRLLVQRVLPAFRLHLQPPRAWPVVKRDCPCLGPGAACGTAIPNNEEIREAEKIATGARVTTAERDGFSGLRGFACFFLAQRRGIDRQRS